jgi:N-acylglucosamine-6-phosphate 2-epimerase
VTKETSLTAMDSPQQSTLSRWLDQVRGRLVVSCQALPGMPFDDPAVLALTAREAAIGGAAAIRANAPANIRAVRAAVALPIIGLFKERLPGFDVYITPTLASAVEAVRAGSDVIALDATARPRQGGETLPDIVRGLHAMGVPVLGDIGTLDDALYAVDAGVDAVATTLRGLTGGPPLEALDLLRQVVAKVSLPVLQEGGVVTPAEARSALDHGAWAVVVGRAITMPHFLTERFARALEARTS